MTMLGGKTTLLISDPDMVQDIFTTQNKIVDKTGSFANIFKDALGDSIFFGKGGATWKAKRQACAHAFYKD